MSVFSERFKELRQEKGLSTKQLGDKLGVKNSTITRWENNLRIPNIESLYKIAVFFNVSSDYLIGLEN